MNNTQSRGVQADLEPDQPAQPGHPAQKPADLTPVTVGGGSPPIKPETGGAIDGFAHEKPIFNQPNRETHREMVTTCSLPILH